tara:strand:- start:18513 stop:19208 length:696 start_codon:yes stop_codon:yes gene_type:complete
MSRVFKSVNKSLDSGERTKKQGQTTIYGYTYQQLKKENPNADYGPLKVNTKNGCLVGAANHKTLLDITAAKYLIDPPKNINLYGGNIIYGNYLQFNATGLNVCEDTKLAYMKANGLMEPDTPNNIEYNTWIYPPPPAYAGIPYPDPDGIHNPSDPGYWTGMLIMDPCMNVFHNPRNKNNNELCSKYAPMEYYQHVDLSGLNTYSFKEAQSKNYLQGMQYPIRFKFTHGTYK